MNDFGMKISLPGKDVKTTADTNLEFSSKFNYMKVYSSGTQSISVATGTGFGSTNIAHGLSFIPFCFVYLKATGGTAEDKTYLLPNHIADGFGFVPLCYYGIDSTNLNIYIAKPSSGTTTWNARYYIFYNQME